MADLFAVLETLGIRKKILYPGKGAAPDYEDGTKVLDSSEIRFILKFLLWYILVVYITVTYFGEQIIRIPAL